jgi:hypothetical protein
VGNFRFGLPNGQGTSIQPDGSYYVGEFKDGNPHGQGTANTAGGDYYVGEFKDGEVNGLGTYTWSNGNKYVGEWWNSKLHGLGIITFADGRSSQEGIFENGQFVSAQRIPDHIVGTASSTASAKNSLTMDSASAKCVELGFKRGTEKFGDCVLKISK